MKEDKSNGEAIELRKDVEAGKLKLADLSQGQVEVILASIEADDAAGQEVSDRTLQIFMELSEVVVKMDSAANFARTASTRVAASQDQLVSAMSGLAGTIGGHHQFNRDMSTQLGEVAEGCASFRRQTDEFLERLTAVQLGFGSKPVNG